MRNAFSILVVLMSALLLNVVDAADYSAAIQQRVSRIYVMRRPLNGQPLNSIGAFAHSALLLETAQGNFYVLEYQRDAKAHLTLGEHKEILENRKKGVAHIRMEGWSNGRVSNFYWERQLIGDPVAGNWTPQEMQRTMQDLMNGYSVLKKEHCHTAQQRLRAALGLAPSSTKVALGVNARES